MRKTDVLKLALEVNFSEIKIAERHWLLRTKRYKVYSGKRLFSVLLPPAVFCRQSLVSDCF